MGKILPSVKIGISSCLLGEQVRFDGGHKRDSFLVQTLGIFVNWCPVCPEVELGLGTPRESIRLLRDQKEAETLRLVAPKSGRDFTARMRRYAKRRTRELIKEDLSGYILKKDSPSCGMKRVKIWQNKGRAERKGRGLFAEELLRQFPNMPVEEEGRLNDPRLRENFIDRIFMYRRIRSFLSSRWNVGNLVAFHTKHKLTLMAHSIEGYRDLGRLVAEAKAIPRIELSRRYEDEFMHAMRKLASRAKHTNTLQHASGHLKKLLDTFSRKELSDIIENYRAGLIPLVVPLTLIRHHARRLEVNYLLDQHYLQPELEELMLRNHV